MSHSGSGSNPMIAQTGVDFVFLDTEHVPIERTGLAWMCRAYDALGLAPIVRIPAPDPYLAYQVLDAMLAVPGIESVFPGTPMARVRSGHGTLP